MSILRAFSGLVTASNGVIVQGADLAINAQNIVTSDGTNEFTISSWRHRNDGSLVVELAQIWVAWK